MGATLDLNTQLLKAVSLLLSSSTREDTRVMVPLESFEYLEDIVYRLRGSYPSPSDYSDLVRGYFSGRGLSVFDIDDLVQDVYEYALERWYLYTSSSLSYSDWLLNICHIVWRRWNARRHARQSHIVSDTGFFRVSPEGDDISSVAISSSVLRHDLSESVVEQLLSRLSPSLRFAFTKYLQGWRYKDALSLGMSSEAFRKRVFRAKLQLRKLVASQ